MQHMQVTSSVVQPPAAWELYFKSVPYNAQDRRAMLIHELVKQLSRSDGSALLKHVRLVHQHYVLHMDYEQLLQNCNSADLVAALEMQPQEGLSCIAAACYEVNIAVFNPTMNPSAPQWHALLEKFAVLLRSCFVLWKGLPQGPGAVCTDATSTAAIALAMAVKHSHNAILCLAGHVYRQLSKSC